MEIKQLELSDELKKLLAWLEYLRSLLEKDWEKIGISEERNGTTKMATNKN